MKRFILILTSIIVFIFTACNMELPQNIYIKLKSQYAFSMGNYEKALSDYISVDTLMDSFNTSASSVKFKIYDYNPDKSNALQQYLIDFSFGEIPINIEQYLSNMDFADQLQNLSFDQNIEIPSLGMKNTPATSISLPDINKKICSSMTLPAQSIPVPASGSISSTQINISVATPTYSQMDFSGGYLNIKVTPPSGATGNVTLNFEVSSAKASVKVTGTEANTAKVPLSGLSLSQTIPLTVSGTSSTGKAGVYAISFEFSDDTKIKKIKGLTMDLGSDSTISLNQTINMSVNETFKECVIGTGELKAYTALPDGWQNVTIIPNLNLSGGITASNSEFVDEAGNYLFNRKLNLAGKTYTTSSNSGNINLSGSLAITLSNSTIVFDNSNSVDVKIECDIGTVTSATVNLASIKDNLSMTNTESLPAEVKEYITEIKLKKSGIKATYTNELPAGNDVTIEAVSSFFNIGSVGSPETKTIAAATTDGSFDLTSSNLTIHPATDDTIDFKVDIKLPGSTSANPEYATFTNIELGKTYKFKVELTPVFDWESVSLDTSSKTITDTVDTDFEIGTVFEELTNVLQDSTVVDKMEFVEIPLYLYAMAPDYEAFQSGLAFNGTLTGKVGSTSVQLLPAPGSGSTIIPISLGKKELETDPKNPDVVISKLDEDTDCTKTDLAALVNAHGSGTLKIDYTLSLTGTSGSAITIKKEDLKDLSISSICIVARMVIKLKLRLTDTIELDLLKLGDLDPNKDLFERTEATDYEDFEKYMDIITSMSIVYSVKNSVLNYEETNKNVKVELVSTSPAIEKTLSLNGGSLSLSMDEMKSVLKCEKFTPTINLTAPAGIINIQRNASIGMNAAIILYADGKVLIN